jgi:hypothetical protein
MAFMGRESADVPDSDVSGRAGLARRWRGSSAKRLSRCWLGPSSESRARRPYAAIAASRVGS